MNDLIVTTETCSDCHETGVGIVILCPRHASIGRLIGALEDIGQLAEGWCCSDDSGNPDNRFEYIANRACALLDELKQAQGTQIPETT
jgi:hypothetical protein